LTVTPLPASAWHKLDVALLIAAFVAAYPGMCASGLEASPLEMWTTRPHPPGFMSGTSSSDYADRPAGAVAIATDNRIGAGSTRHNPAVGMMPQVVKPDPPQLRLLENPIRHECPRGSTSGPFSDTPSLPAPAPTIRVWGPVPRSHRIRHRTDSVVGRLMDT
jgi:hypothetical protein